MPTLEQPAALESYRPEEVLRISDFYKPWEHQKQWHELICRHKLQIGSFGSGKAFSYDQLVVTPFGHRSIGELKVGSLISNPSGSTGHVIAVLPQGEQPFYRITFRDGDKVECSAGHLWPCWVNADKDDKRQLPYIIRTTEQMYTLFDKIQKRRFQTRLQVPTTSPLRFALGKSQQICIDPYTLGVLIGDGALQKGAAYSSADPEIADSIPYPVVKHKGKFGYHISGLAPQLRALGLLKKHSWEKFVPQCYLWASVEQRMALLQGLMDTDGTVDKLGHLSFCTTSSQLAKDVKFLIQSLGGLATITESEKFFSDKDGNKKAGRLAIHFCT